MDFAQDVVTLSPSGCRATRFQSVRLHGWTWPLNIAFADPFTLWLGLSLALAREHEQGARQEKVRVLTQLFNTAT